MQETRRLDDLERTTEQLGERLARLEATLDPAARRIADPLETAKAARVERAAREAASRAGLDAPERPATPRPGTAKGPPSRRPATPKPAATAGPSPAPNASPAAGPSPARAPKASPPLASWAPVAAATARQASKVPVPATAAQRPTLEDVLAGRILAWAGGLAVLVGIVLLFAVAVSRGWIGEGARTLMGGLASFSLVVAGAWLHERRGRTDAALAAAAAGLGGLFVTAVVAARVYEVVAVEAGMAAALATGAAATALALRWRAPGIAALGILGGLVSPVVVGAPQDGGTLAILLVAALSAAAVCVRQRWDWLALAAYLVVTPQWILYLAGDPATLPALATLAGFGAVAAASAVGLELRERAATVRPASIVLLALNAFLLAYVGWQTLDASPLWLAALAAVHVAAGLALLRDERASRAVGVLACTLGAVLADVALGWTLDGPALTIAWAAVAVGFAALVRTARGALDDVAVATGLGAHVALALMHALAVDAQPDPVAAGATIGVAASAALAALAASCFASGLVLAQRAEWRLPLHALGLATVAYLAAANLDGAVLVAAWAVEAIALAELARRRRDVFALGASVAHLALAAAHALTLEAPAATVAGGPADLPAAALAVGAVAAAAWRAAVAAGTVSAPWRAPLQAVALSAVAYFAAQALDGAALVAAWSALAVVLAEWARERRDRVAGTAAGALVALAAGHAVAFEARPDMLAGGPADLSSAALALGCVAMAAWRAGRAAATGVVVDDDPIWRLLLHGAALASLGYLAAQALEGPVLVAVWCAMAVALVEAARLRRPTAWAFGATRGEDEVDADGAGVAGVAGAVLLGLGVAHAVALEAPVVALLDGLADPAAAAVALGASVLAAWRFAVMAHERMLRTRLTELDPGHGRPTAAAETLRQVTLTAATTGALVALHLASTQLVTAAGAGPRAQALLSALWGVVGVAALIAGLVRDVGPLRTGALTLLLGALAKVFLYDLSTLTPIARVVSFIALGLLLLLGAFAWQRLRPRPLPDLREATPAARG